MITFCRFYHTTHSVFSVKKQGMKLMKMINPKAKKQWFPTQTFEANSLPSIKSLAKTKNEPGKRANRRVAMLNKMFMKQITDIMSTGTVSMDIVGRGIEISKVNITPDFQTVNVFWVCKGNINDDETEAVLKKTAGALRNELSTLRVMGEVPYITFVKDKQEAITVDLERRLAIADYGPEYEPTEIGHLLKTEFTLNTKLSPEMKAKIKQLEDDLPLVEEPVPEMTHTVFGLDHAQIINRLLAARKRSRDAWLNVDADSVISYRTPEARTSDVDLIAQKRELAEFLMKRQILQNKLQKQIRRTSEEWQLEPRFEENDEQPLDDDDDYYDDDEDYIDDYNYVENVKPHPGQKLA